MSSCVSRWVESSTRLGSFRALKKTPEAPYTTKVNYRKCTSRGCVEPPTCAIRKPPSEDSTRSPGGVYATCILLFFGKQGLDHHLVSYSPPFPCLTVVGRERGAGTSS